MATKKIVSATPTARSSSGQSGGAPRPTFTASPEAKRQALTFRLIAIGLWVVAIGIEAFAIFWLLKHTELNGFMVWLIVAIVVIGAFALGGSMLWKKSNRLDPASEKDPIRFFVQNQLGAIITIVAFLPLIILIFMNKDMDGKQKGIAGAIGIIAMLAVGAASIDYAPPSQEQMTEQEAIVKAYTGSDQVYWVKNGSVYHLCAEDPATGSTIAALARGDADQNPVVAGTVADAVAAGKERLSMYGFSECGFTEGQPANPQWLDGSGSAPSATPEPSATAS
ncbi:MAG: hypothetical protein LBV06_09485 [Propionibacteriaceae bacterium]|jgi:hypothetical protein|nr:hypothetical protein [Propionibacteriaceae bacterium]